jgi:hypothetical protein
MHLKNRGKSPPFAHKNNTAKDMHIGPPRKLHYAKYMQTQEFVSRLVLVMVCLFDFDDSNLG